MSSDIEWRWADPSGQQRLVREDELRAALASGLIPPNAPVWKYGWKEWQPAYSVPELTTSALAAANGVVPNIPPPPLGVLDAQKTLEKEGESLLPGKMRAKLGTEPPVPPRYVPAATRVNAPARPASGPSLNAAAGSRSKIALRPRETPSSKQKAAPLAKENAAAVVLPAEEAKTDVRQRIIEEAKPTASEKPEPQRAKQENLPTAIGMPALPQGSVRQTGSAALAATLTPGQAPTRSRMPSTPPPLPPTRSKSKPPPAPLSKKKKSATLILYGGAPQTPVPPSEGNPAPPINVPGPGGQAPQAITRPPPGDGEAKVSAPPGPLEQEEEENVEELSSSILLEDRESGSDSVVLSDSVRKVSSSAPPSPVKKAGASGTLLGFPVPTAPAVPDIPVPGVRDVDGREAGARSVDTAPRATLDSRAEASTPGIPANRILHDLRELMKRPRPKWFWPAVGGGGAVVFVGLLGILIGAVRSGNAEEIKPIAVPPVIPTATAPTTGTGTASAAAPEPATLPGAGATCAASGGSHTLSPRALVPTGVEVAASGNTVGVAFAVGPKDAMGIEVDPSTLTVGGATKYHTFDPLKRVTPDASSGRLVAVAEIDRKTDRLQGRRSIPGTSVDIGVADGGLAWAPHAKDAATKIWPIDGDPALDALRGVSIDMKGERGVAIAFRRAGAIWMGAAFGDKLAPRGALVRVEGLSPVIGSPTLAAAGDTILVAWADRASATDPWGLRWTRFTPGEAPREAVSFRVPAGGLGEHAMSPWLTRVAPDRVLLLWTEGPVSRHQVRAQTLSSDGALVGEAFTVSAEGVNAGQAQAAVTADGRGVVAFLAANGKNYEVVGTPITCAAK